ncbi:MAG: ABC transporter permease [Segniliparus sp.]|uniref:ABC transporter permease n=1 Tax=Segniliparus sp. TaxID=2804064 RepID=UPI003F41A0C2
MSTTMRRALPVALVALLVSAITALTKAYDLTSPGVVRTGVALAIPIALAALGGLWAERSGVVNIGLEGMMILGTWGAAWGSLECGPLFGLLVAALFGAAGGALHALATVTFRVNHIVSGVAINLLGAGATKYLANLVFFPKSKNPRESPPVETLRSFDLPLVPDWCQSLADRHWFLVSDLAGVVGGLTSGLSVLTVGGLALVPLSFWILWRTRFGLRLRACGENPAAAASLGVKVRSRQYVALLISGGLAGLGGAALVVAPGQIGYSEGQTGGRGYIGLAAMIFGNWRPGGLLGASALFGYADGLRLSTPAWVVGAFLYGAVLVLAVIAAARLSRGQRTAGLVTAGIAACLWCLYWFTSELPSEFTDYLPHILTLMVLAIGASRLRPPAALGETEAPGH